MISYTTCKAPRMSDCGLLTIHRCTISYTLIHFCIMLRSFTNLPDMECPDREKLSVSDIKQFHSDGSISDQLIPHLWPEVRICLQKR